MFDEIASNLSENGYSVQKNALPEALGNCLWDESHAESGAALQSAGVGRKQKKHIDHGIRSDKISWIDDTTAAGVEWLKWTAELQNGLNSSLFLGLFNFESHYALYEPACFYRTHYDAFRGEKNRIVSIIIYLNRDWQKSDAGELVLFTAGDDRIPLMVSPEYGTVVAFLSEEVPHEVLVTNRDRHSIAGWFCARRDNLLS